MKWYHFFPWDAVWVIGSVVACIVLFIWFISENSHHAICRKAFPEYSYVDIDYCANLRGKEGKHLHEIRDIIGKKNVQD